MNLDELQRRAEHPNIYGNVTVVASDLLALIYFTRLAQWTLAERGLRILDLATKTFPECVSH
jgi:hypothetical protein